MPRLALVSSILFGSSLLAPKPDCFTGHLEDAIALNEARAETYAALSGGESRTLSRILVASEYATLALAHVVEVLAARYWAHDVPILCADFVPMSETPPVQSAVDPAPPSLAAFKPVDVDAMSRTLREALGEGSFAAVHKAAESEIAKLDAEPRLHCMTRHMLESAARIAWLAPQYEARASKLDLALSPLHLSRALLEMHLAGLALARDIDERAAPLAAKGVRIVCDDVPRIGTRPRL